MHTIERAVRRQSRWTPRVSRSLGWLAQNPNAKCPPLKFQTKVCFPNGIILVTNSKYSIHGSRRSRK